MKSWLITVGEYTFSYNEYIAELRPSSFFLFKTHLSFIGLSVPHRKHISSPLRAQQGNAIYRCVTMVY
jgi:hypothetical protein